MTLFGPIGADVRQYCVGLLLYGLLYFLHNIRKFRLTSGGFNSANKISKKFYHHNLSIFHIISISN